MQHLRGDARARDQAAAQVTVQLEAGYHILGHGRLGGAIAVGVLRLAGVEPKLSAKGVW